MQRPLLSALCRFGRNLRTRACTCGPKGRGWTRAACGLIWYAKRTARSASRPNEECACAACVATTRVATRRRASGRIDATGSIDATELHRHDHTPSNARPCRAQGPAHQHYMRHATSSIQRHTTRPSCSKPSLSGRAVPHPLGRPALDFCLRFRCLGTAPLTRLAGNGAHVRAHKHRAVAPDQPPLPSHAQAAAVNRTRREHRAQACDAR